MIRKHPAMVAFTLTYLIAAAVRMVMVGSSEFMLYMGQMVVMIGLILWAHRKARFSGGVLWGLSIWGALHMAGGLVPVPTELAQLKSPEQTEAVLYSLWLIQPERLKYDNVVHFFGFFIATLACWQALRRFLGARSRPSIAFVVILTCAGMGLGAVNEIIEFVAWKLFPDSNVGGYENNAIDLIYNALGAGLASILVWLRHPNSFPSWYARDTGR